MYKFLQRGNFVPQFIGAAKKQAVIHYVSVRMFYVINSSYSSSVVWQTQAPLKY